MIADLKPYQAYKDSGVPGLGAVDLPLRATFSPAHPLARRDVPLARARGVRDRALREHRRSSGPSPFFSISVSDPKSGRRVRLALSPLRG